MKSIVIHATRTGNTGLVANAIAAALATHGEATIMAADDVDGQLPAADLVVIGSPTEGHGAHPALDALLGRLGPAGFRDRAFAAFDTRVAWPQWLSGSAASTIRRRAVKAGGRLIGPELSCIVTMKPELEPGQADRATAWAHALARLVEPERVAVAG